MSALIEQDAPPMRVDFRRLVNQAKFGTLSLGSAKELVLCALGEPDRVARRKTVEILKYSNVHFHLVEDRVQLIAIDFGPRKKWCPSVVPKNWPAERSQDIGEFEQFLRHAEISFRTSKQLTFGIQRTLLLGKARICAIFADGHLESIQLSRQTLPSSGRKRH